ncbi:MAG: Fic family protein [Prevotellaceae bacterium]|jgi:Fic family protein|nr:Fic family protein [Prevotellaceae bacterium]
MSSQPPFTLTTRTTNLLADISEHIGKIQGAGEYQRNLHLRKVNRIRSIQSSTAIEGNTLSVEQITDIINGKRVLGNPREIKEVKNAYEAYEKILTFNPYSVKDFLSAHGYMTLDLVKSTGKFRSGNVGVFDGNRITHLGANPSFVPNLIADLFDWANKTDVHPLIKSAVVHFEIEFIHPFDDGNGRMGRLWQTLVLSRWHEIFAWIPIETVIYENQQEYYRVLGESENTADSGAFIEFMLEVILKTIKELPVRKITDILPEIITDKLKKAELEFLKSIIGFLENNGSIDSYHAQLLTNKSAESVKKYFATFVNLGILSSEGATKGRKYQLNKKIFLQKNLHAPK